MILLDTIHLNPDNPRLPMTDKQFKALQKSIKRDPEFMEKRPIVIDENRMILGGNRRYDACLALGMIEVPDSWVADASEWSEAKRKRFIMVDNSPPGISGDWDRDKFSEWPQEDLEEWGLWEEPFKLPADNKQIDEDSMSETEHECPQCGFKW